MSQPTSRYIYSSNSNIEQSLVKMKHNGRNYVQLPSADLFPVEPQRRCCGLRSKLSVRKRQLTYSFCWRQFFAHAR